MPRGVRKVCRVGALPVLSQDVNLLATSDRLTSPLLLHMRRGEQPDLTTILPGFAHTVISASCEDRYQTHTHHPSGVVPAGSTLLGVECPLHIAAHTPLTIAWGSREGGSGQERERDADTLSG